MSGAVRGRSQMKTQLRMAKNRSHGANVFMVATMQHNSGGGKDAAETNKEILLRTPPFGGPRDR